MLEGFLVIDKPPGITSHDVVALLRAVLGIRRIGHTGTLDPFATGVLAVAIGRVTRLIQFLDEDCKVYDAVMMLGQATTTGDPEGEIIQQADVPAMDGEAIATVLNGFVGPRMQTPPMYSAVKVNGRPLYSYARAGESVSVPARPIRIDALNLHSWQSPHLRVHVTCGKGTYVRVLAEEVGEALGSAAHLIGLRRERSGPFHIGDALSFEALSEIVTGQRDWQTALRPNRGEDRVAWRPKADVRDALRSRMITGLQAMNHLPSTILKPAEVLHVRAGGQPPPPPKVLPEGAQYVLQADDALVGIAKVHRGKGQLSRVLSEESKSSRRGRRR